MLESINTESTEREQPVPPCKRWPDIMGKAAFGRYRKEAFGVGTPAAVTGWIKTGKITPPALRPDGKINRQAADMQLATRRDPARTQDPPPDLQDQTEDTDMEDDPDELPLLAANPSYAASKSELVREQVRAKRMANDIAEGRYVDAESVRLATVDMARATRDRILAVPANVAGALVGKDEREISALLRDALKAALRGMSDDMEPANGSGVSV